MLAKVMSAHIMPKRKLSAGVDDWIEAMGSSAESDLMACSAHLGHNQVSLRSLEFVFCLLPEERIKSRKVP